MISLSSYTQDIHFSQFFFAPQLLNPANNGNFDGNWRVTNNTRRQWGVISPYTTFSLGFDKQAYIRNNNFSIGAYLVNDMSNSSSLVVNKFYLAGAYHKPLGSTQKLSLGLQAGVVSKHFSSSKLSFPDQFNSNPDAGVFDPGMATGETGYRENILYPDVNVGVNWGATLAFLRPHIGIAGFHVNMPNETVFSNKNHLQPRLVGHAGTDILFGEILYLTPNFMYMTHAGATEMIMGSNLTYVFSGNYLENSIFVGAYTRNKDSFIALVGCNYQHWRVGLSYDLNTSDLRTSASNPGGWELSVVYREISTQIKKIFIPCERF